MESAIKKEARDLIVEAIEEYERMIDNKKDVSVAAFINLAFDYWQCTDFGFAVAHTLDDKLQQKAFRRSLEVLDQAEQCHPSFPEIRFWRLYFRFITLGSNEINDAIDSILADPKCSIIPFFFLFMINRPLDQKKVIELSGEIEKTSTYKHRYIKSILGSHPWGLPSHCSPPLPSPE